jgi:hypothetical protein
MPAGRPPKKIDILTLERLALINCSWAEAAACLDVDEATLTRNKKYSQVFKAGREKGKMSLKRQMWRKAIDENNTTMQIFLAKNMLGYSDKVDHNSPEANVVQDQIKQLVEWFERLQSK